MSVSARDLQKFGDALSEYVKKVQVHGFKHASSIALFSSSRHFSDLLSGLPSGDFSEYANTDNFEEQIKRINWDDPLLQNTTFAVVLKQLLHTRKNSKQLKDLKMGVNILYNLLRTAHKLQKKSLYFTRITFERICTAVGHEKAKTIEKLFHYTPESDEFETYAEEFMARISNPEKNDVSEEVIEEQLRDVLHGAEEA